MENKNSYSVIEICAKFNIINFNSIVRIEPVDEFEDGMHIVGVNVYFDTGKMGFWLTPIEKLLNAMECAGHKVEDNYGAFLYLKR